MEEKVFMIEIAVLSYNRPKELKRTLDSCLKLSKDHFKVVVYDDMSPRQDEIVAMFNSFFEKETNFYLLARKQNLGYDLSLLNAISSSTAEYVILLSDDDYLDFGDDGLSLCNKLAELSFGVGILSYKFATELISRENIQRRVRYRRPLSKSISLEYKEVVDKPYNIYHFILFSGLIFKPSDIDQEHFQKFHGSIYMQVALAMTLMVKGVVFFDGIEIIVGSDGENGFGNNKNRQNRDIELQHRDHVTSNWRYQKRLLNVVHDRSRHLNSRILWRRFKREWRLRTIYSFIVIRSDSFKDYMQLLKFVHRDVALLIPYLAIVLVPPTIVSQIIKFKKILERKRGFNQGV